MIYSKVIHRSKYVLGGTPVFSGTRVPAQALIDYLEEGKTLDDFLEDFPSVNRKQAMHILEAFRKELLGEKRESAA